MLGSLILILGLIFLGIPLLVKTAVFLGDLSASKHPVDKTDIIAPAPPRLILPYEATNSANLTIDGYSEKGVSVFLTQNGDSLGSTTAKDDGTFSFLVTLKSGDNNFIAVAIDQAGNKSQPSENQTIYFSNKPPELTVETSNITSNQVDVNGSTNGVRLVVNDRLIIINSDGKFQTKISLNPGENTLTFIASDRAGNQTKKELKVTTTP